MLVRIYRLMADSGWLAMCLFVVAAITLFHSLKFGIFGYLITVGVLLFAVILHHRRGFLDRHRVAAWKRPGPTMGLLVLAFFTFVAADESARIARSIDLNLEKEASANAEQPDISFDEGISQQFERDVISGCVAIDGDTLRCGGEVIRLLGIDAPEMPGHCAPGRACVLGDPFAAKRSIEELIEPTLEIVRYGADRYGRTLAMVYGRSGSLSCRQLRSGHATYILEWDNDGALSADCPVNAG